jgi:hypothetical protein
LQALLVLQPRLGLIFDERRQDGFISQAEEMVLERPYGIEVGLIADDVDARQLLRRRRGNALRRDGRRHELAADERLQILERRLQQFGRGMDFRVVSEMFDERLLTLVLDVELGRDPDQTGQAAAASDFGGQSLLPHDARLAPPFRHHAVVSADEVNRDFAPAELVAHQRIELAGHQRQRTVGKNLIAVTHQIALDRLALVAQLEGRLRHVGRPFGHLWRFGFAAAVPGNGLQELRDVVGQVVELRQKGAVRTRPVLRRQFVRTPRLRVVDEKLVAQHRLDFFRQALAHHRRLHHFEDAGLVAHPNAALALRGPAELLQLAVAPLGLHVARRENGDQRGDARQALENGVREIVVSLKLGVAPNPWDLTANLTHADLQQAMELRDPTLFALHERLIVNVGVADEEIVIVVHP